MPLSGDKPVLLDHISDAEERKLARVLDPLPRSSAAVRALKDGDNLVVDIDAVEYLREAAVRLDHARRAEPSEPAYPLTAARYLFRTLDFQGALKLVRDARLALPLDPRLMYLEAMFLQTLGMPRPSERGTSWEEVLSILPPEVRGHFQIALLRTCETMSLSVGTVREQAVVLFRKILATTRLDDFDQDRCRRAMESYENLLLTMPLYRGVLNAAERVGMRLPGSTREVARKIGVDYLFDIGHAEAGRGDGFVVGILSGSMARLDPLWPVLNVAVAVFDSTENAAGVWEFNATTDKASILDGPTTSEQVGDRSFTRRLRRVSETANEPRYGHAVQLQLGRLLAVIGLFQNQCYRDEAELRRLAIDLCALLESAVEESANTDPE